MKKLLAFLRYTALWILLLPPAFHFVGAASNQLVLIANHDKFPVMENDWRASNETVLNGIIDPGGHCLMTSDTHLNFLADIFDFHDGIYSIGDLMLMTGDWLDSFCIYVWLALIIKKLHEGSLQRTLDRL
jgi:hypothetical protein